MKKNILSVSIFVVGLIFLSCNTAEDGYNASTGSTVSFTSVAPAFTLAAEGPPNTCVTSGLANATFQVFVPIGAAAEAPGDLTQATNKIHGVLDASGATLYKYHDDIETFLPEFSLVDVVAAGAFPFVTNDRGLFTLAYTVTGCWDADGAPITGTAQIRADIGVSIGILDISITSG